MMTPTQDNFEEHVQNYLDLLIGPRYKSYKAQKEAVAKLQEIGENRLFPLLIPMLDSPTLETRLQASRAILSIDEQKGIELLLPYLNDPDSEFRYDICGLMHDFGNSRVIPALIELMQNDTDPQIRGTAAFALGGIGDSQAIPALTRTMNSDHEFDLYGHSPSSSAEYALKEIQEKANKA
jgi:HEAT repeat protein